MNPRTRQRRITSDRACNQRQCFDRPDVGRRRTASIDPCDRQSSPVRSAYSMSPCVTAYCTRSEFFASWSFSMSLAR